MLQQTWLKSMAPPGEYQYRPQTTSPRQATRPLLRAHPPIDGSLSARQLPPHGQPQLRAVPNPSQPQLRPVPPPPTAVRNLRPSTQQGAHSWGPPQHVPEDRLPWDPRAARRELHAAGPPDLREPLSPRRVLPPPPYLLPSSRGEVLALKERLRAQLACGGGRGAIDSAWHDAFSEVVRQVCLLYYPPMLPSYAA